MNKRGRDKHAQSIIKGILMAVFGSKCMICEEVKLERGNDNTQVIQLHHNWKNKGDNSFDNCSLLCDKCHTKLHKIEGTDKYTEMIKQIQEYKIGFHRKKG